MVHFLRQVFCIILVILGFVLSINFNFTVGILISAGGLLALVVPIVEETLEIIDRKNKH